MDILEDFVKYIKSRFLNLVRTYSLLYVNAYMEKVLTEK